MLKSTRYSQVYLAAGVTDLRKSIDGLSLIVSERFKLDPFSRKRDKIKILEWDTTGFWLHYKRLEKDTFQWPVANGQTHLSVDERAFRWLLDGLSIRERHAHKHIEERQLI